ncbi:dTDP-4-amino-4,6-dideoxygalactose transaminase [Mesorhizobium sp. 10J20-29]
MELAYIGESLKARAIAGPGAQTAACEALMGAQVGSPSAFLVPSCTAALEMCALLLGLGPGDEVIMPSFTFVSNPNAVVLRRATPVFVDVDPITFNVDPSSVEVAVTSRTRAIFVTHYAGVPADMETILRIAEPHGIAVVEDAAQAYGSQRNGRMAGTFAKLACFSFHGTKNIAAGEAGALVVNDIKLAAEAAVMREKGTDRSRFLAGEVDFYTWQDVGSSQIVSEMTAAFLRAQLERAGTITAMRRSQWNYYRECLGDLAADGCFDLPSPPPEVDHNGHIFFLVLPSRRHRDHLASELRQHGISALTHYVPLHSSPAGQRYCRTVGQMSGTDRATDCLLRLPLYHDLGSKQDLVIDAVREWSDRGSVA